MRCELEDITIHYEMFGTGRPVLFLHGWSLDHRYEVSSFEPVFKQRQGWKRIYINLPGQGKTPGVNWINNQDQMLEVVLRFIDKVISGESFLLVGTSAGAYLARGVIYCRATDVDGLLIRIPLIVADDTKRTLPMHKAIVEDEDFMSSLSAEDAEYYQDILIQTSDYFDQVKLIMERDIFPAQRLYDEEFLSRIRETPKNYGYSFDVDDLAKPFKEPSLFIMGRQDTIAGYRDAWKILENYPRATFVVLDRAGHGIPLGQEALFESLVNEWLDRVEEYVG